MNRPMRVALAAAVLGASVAASGAMAAEAVVFFDPARAANMSERRKRGGHLISKHRFVAAQFEAFFAADLWLKLARHANDMADRLAAKLTAAGVVPLWPVEANEVFVVLPSRTDRRLKAAGAVYYPWAAQALPRGRVVRRGGAAGSLKRTGRPGDEAARRTMRA